MIRTIYEAARNQTLVVRTRPMNLITGIAMPLMLMTLLTLPRLERLTPVQVTGVFTGVLLASFWGASLWSGAGILRRERWQGTLAPSFTGRADPVAVLLGKALGGVVYDVALICVSNTAFVLVVGLRLQVADAWAFGLGIVAVIACGVASSLFLGAALMLSRYAFQLTTAVGTPVMLLGGTIIPHDILPAWVAAIGNLINLAWLQRFMASTATTTEWGALLIGVGLSGLYAAAGVWCVRVFLDRARKEGTVELA